MSRLDQHIAAVQNKLALGLFVRTLAMAAMSFAGLVLLVIVAERMLDRVLPHHLMLFLIGCGVMVGFSLGYSLWRRPGAKATAVAIDQVLGLKEKFSTALYVRPLRDPFAMAAVKDAEREANNVSLYNRFPIEFPKQAFGAAGVGLLALMAGMFLPPMHWGSNSQANKPTDKPPEATTANPIVPKEAIAKMQQAVNPMNENSTAIQLASEQLKKALNTNEPDAHKKELSALQAMEGMKKAMREELDKSKDAQTVFEEEKRLASMPDAADESTPIGKAQDDLKKGNIDKAMDDLSSAVANFDKVKPEEQQKMVDQAKKMAEALAKAANDPAVEKKMEEKLSQMGANPQQAQTMAKAMQQAAQGNPQAQQQMQQMAQQIQQQMNNGNGPTQAQQQQIQKMMAQMQGMAASQMQAGAMSQSTQKLAQAMQQAAQGQSGQPGQQQQGAGQMQQASANLQQQMAQMSANAKDAQAMKAAADAQAQGSGSGAGEKPGQGEGQGQGAQAGAGQGKGNAQGKKGDGEGDPNDQQNGGQGGNAKGPGGHHDSIAQAGFDMKAETDTGVQSPNGEILASRLVNAGVTPGKSNAELRKVAVSAEKEAADEIDSEPFSHDTKQAVKDYFTTMQNAGN